MHVIAHDPGFDQARLGLLCCYLSICESIRRGMREYHLLSGRYDYKRRLRGQQRLHRMTHQDVGIARHREDQFDRIGFPAMRGAQARAGFIGLRHGERGIAGAEAQARRASRDRHAAILAAA